MASRTYLVARVGSAQVWWWDPKNGGAHSGISEYADLLATVFEEPPSTGQLRRAMDDVRVAVSEADGHAALHSNALMDEETWSRFSSPQHGTLEVLRCTGLQAEIHFHENLEAALEVYRAGPDSARLNDWVAGDRTSRPG